MSTRKVTQTQTQTQTPTLPYVKCECVKVKTVTALLAPKIPSFEISETLMSELRARWGEDKAKHLDYVFPRGHLLVREAGTLKTYKCVVVLGTRIYGALKQNAGIGGKPLSGNWQIIGLYFPEERTMIHASKTTIKISREKVEKDEKKRYTILGEAPDGSVFVSTLVNYEAVPPQTYGWLVVRNIELIPSELKLPTVQVGSKKKLGFGWLEINWNAVEECYIV